MLRPRTGRDPPLTPAHLHHVTPPFRTFGGEGALKALPRELDRVGCQRTVLVTGPWLAAHPAVATMVREAVGPRLAGVFDGVAPHSPLPSVDAAAAVLAGCSADSIVALGGGSAIVTARAASILLAEKRPARHMCTHRSEDGTLVSPKLLAPKLPNWVVPTTPTTAYARAGSAVHDAETGERLALFDPKTRAQGIIVDAAVVLTAPRSLVSSAALNALAMAVESIQAGVDDALADALLLHGLRELVRWLPSLDADPDAAEPRMRLMLAALLSGQGSEYVRGRLAQALAHSVGPRSTVANGVVEAMLLRHTLRFTAEASPGRLGPVADVVARPGRPRSDGVAIDALVTFLDRLGVPARLRDVGVARYAIEEVVDHVADDWFLTGVPRTPTRADLVALLERAW